MSDQWMPLPAPPPAPKKKRWSLALGAAAILVVGIAIGTGDTSTPEAPSATATPSVAAPAERVTAAEFVDVAFTSRQQTKFCIAYFGLGDDDMAFRAFNDGWTTPPEPGLPTVAQVFDELVSRC